jgi:hypothetical protein
MTTEINQKKTKQRVEIGFGITLGETAVAFFGALISGILAAGKTIQDRFMEDVKKSCDIGPLLQEHAEKLAQINSDHYANKKDLWAKIRSMKAENAEEFAKVVLEKRGVEDSMIKGTWQRLQTLSPRSNKALAFNTTIATVLGTAMALSFFNGLATRDKIERIEEVTGADKISR